MHLTWWQTPVRCQLSFVVVVFFFFECRWKHFPFFFSRKEEKNAEKICIDKLYIGVKKCLFSYFSLSFKDLGFFSVFFPYFSRSFFLVSSKYTYWVKVTTTTRKKITSFVRWLRARTIFFFLSQSCIHPLHCALWCLFFFISLSFAACM